MNKTQHGICGWELNNPDPELFDTQILEVFGACKTCEHLHQCAVPSESIRCLVPRKGRLVSLGQEHAEDGQSISYFALVHEEAVRFIQLSEPQYYWAKARWVEKADVPQHGLSRLERELGESSTGFPATG